ncbi:MAG: hypothetical protein IPO62_13210 [Saprospiraceae bacterium]|nr:hypothetical protein [Saprospiraceae bacterium]
MGNEGINVAGIKSNLNILFGYLNCNISTEISIEKPIQCASLSFDDIWLIIGNDRDAIFSLINTGVYNEVVSQKFIRNKLNGLITAIENNAETTAPRNDDKNLTNWTPISSGVGLIDTEPNGISSWRSILFNCSSEMAVAFLCLHSIGHSAGIDHSVDIDIWNKTISNNNPGVDRPDASGFMAHAVQI